MKGVFVRNSKFLLIFVILGIPCLLSVAWGQPTELDWNTFEGGLGADVGRDIAVDGSGNVYVIGESNMSWGTPINAHASGGFNDAFVAKFDPSGTLLWHTFLGGSHHDYAYGIAVDESGDIYVAGHSFQSWGAPANAHAGDYDGFMAKLSSSGVYQGHTFFGSATKDFAYAVDVDGSGNVYVTGTSDATWGSPVDAYTGLNDAYAVKLSPIGAVVWNTFMGTSNYEHGRAIDVDGSGNVYVAGMGQGTWGSPVSAFIGGNDVFAVKLNSSGTRVWNTFMGSADSDDVYGIAVDGSGNVYMAGMSVTTWGSPINAHAGSFDVFAAVLNSSGTRRWNTFMGSASGDLCWDLVIDESRNMYITGRSQATWGSPDNAFAGSDDVYVVKLNSGGMQLWNTFMGSSDEDNANGIALNMDREVFVCGVSHATWGSPVDPHVRDEDIFAAKLKMVDPEPDIKANGSDKTITISQGDPLSITFELFGRDELGNSADWWLLIKTDNPPPNKWLYYDHGTKSYIPGRVPSAIGYIRDFYPPKKVPGTSGFAAGTYTFYFAVDMVQNGVIDVGAAFYDSVKVIINP